MQIQNYVVSLRYNSKRNKMIIEFKVENFLSFKDLTTLSMVKAKSFKEHNDTHTISIDDKLSLLKSAIIYGNNASGKSNLLKAMEFMKWTVLNSFREALVNDTDKKFPLEKFALNAKTETESTFFEVSFFNNDTKYRYGFEINQDKVVAEWLYHTTTKEVYLFKRELQKIEINKSAFKEGLGKENDVKENVLFLSVLATFGKEVSSNIIQWFKNFNLINATYDNRHKKYTVDKLKTDKDFFNWVLHFIKYLEISSLSTGEEDVNSLEIVFTNASNESQEVANLPASIKNEKSKRDFLLSYHRKYDDNNMLIDTIPFNFDAQESAGTKKLLYLLGPLYDTLKNGKVLIIDELDSKLHSHLTLRIIEFFHKCNTNKAQLICTVHDISLLNKETFRRDQIWFIEKNQFGASEFLSLADFKTDKVRNNSAFAKNYRDGKYGAIPYFDIDAKLNQLLYGKE